MVSVVPDESGAYPTALKVDGFVVSVVSDESDSHRTALKVDGCVVLVLWMLVEQIMGLCV